jgi:uncharacterized protein (UPF0332 family)
MTGRDAKAMSGFRLDKAKESLAASQVLLDSEHYGDSACRSYYAVFHAIRAVLALDNFDAKKHSGIISEFRKRYIKTGVFNIELSDIITSLFNIRNNSDYEDFFVISKEKVSQQLKNAALFVETVERYLKTL